MTALSFDTLAYSKTLKSAGFTEQQAEVLAEQNAHILHNDVATKADIREVKAELRLVEATLQADIKAFKKETRESFSSLKEETQSSINALREEAQASDSSLKEEMYAIRDSLETKIEVMGESLKAYIQLEIEKLRSETFKWAVTFVVLIIGSVIATAKFFQ